MTDSRNMFSNEEEVDKNVIDEMEFIFLRAKKELDKQTLSHESDIFNELTNGEHSSFSSIISVVMLFLAVFFFLCSCLLIGYVDSQNILFIPDQNDQSLGLYLTLAILLSVILLLSVYHQMNQPKSIWNKFRLSMKKKYWPRIFTDFHG